MKKGTIVEWNKERFIIEKLLPYAFIVRDINNNIIQIPRNVYIVKNTVAWLFGHRHINDFFPDILINAAKSKFLRLTKSQRAFDKDFSFYVHCCVESYNSAICEFVVSYTDWSSGGDNKLIIPNQTIRLRNLY